MPLARLRVSPPTIARSPLFFPFFLSLAPHLFFGVPAQFLTLSILLFVISPRLPCSCPPFGVRVQCVKAALETVVLCPLEGPLYHCHSRGHVSTRRGRPIQSAHRPHGLAARSFIPIVAVVDPFTPSRCSRRGICGPVAVSGGATSACWTSFVWGCFVPCVVTAGARCAGLPPPKLSSLAHPFALVTVAAAAAAATAAVAVAAADVRVGGWTTNGTPSTTIVWPPLPPPPQPSASSPSCTCACLRPLPWICLSTVAACNCRSVARWPWALGSFGSRMVVETGKPNGAPQGAGCCPGGAQLDGLVAGTDSVASLHDISATRVWRATVDGHRCYTRPCGATMATTTRKGPWGRTPHGDSLPAAV